MEAWLIEAEREALLEFKVSSTAHDHTMMKNRGRWVVRRGGGGGGEVNYHYDKGYVMCY